MSETEPTFATVRRGYDPAQVQSYLGPLAEQVRSLSEQVRSLGSELEQTRQERDAAIQERSSASAASYEQASARVAELMQTLDRDVERIRGEAEAETEDILDRARSEAYQIRAEAEELHRAAEQTRDDADRSVEDVKARRDDVLHDLRDTFTRVLSTIANLAASIDDEHLSDDPDAPVVLPDVMPERPA